jgi:type IV pilus assembly protein PilA
VPTLADPKAGGATITCPSGLTGANAETYFKSYALATIKNPYNTSSTTNVVTAIPPTNTGDLGISGTATANCTGLSIQTLILNSDGVTTANYPVAAECINLQ